MTTTCECHGMELPDCPADIPYQNFIAGRRWVPCLEAELKFGFEIGVPGIVYQDGLHIVDRSCGGDPCYELTIFHDMWISPSLADLEPHLFDYFVSERW